MEKLTLYNTLSRKKEIFEPIASPHVGMYVCGPTVYGDAHLGHARAGITFDLVFRYLQHLDYKVRYVRNITDVGHLENDSDEGEDKISKKARVEQLEPMEVAQYYTDRYHEDMDALNVKRPSIEPRASGHILEQIELVKKLLEKGYAYETNGSVYFDVNKYQNETHLYGILSGRIVEDLLSTTRELDGQSEKRNSADFALWKKASPSHIMRWNSPWGEGFPGWHTECTAMGSKYLGETFDIHGGGLDLLFPHHESEVAQHTAVCGHGPCKYWLHNNMITINGQKMGKSLGNFITLKELFTGNHKALEKAYSPMTIRFFILQAHYRSTLDFSNEALQAAEKGLARLFSSLRLIDKLAPAATSSVNINDLKDKFYEAMNDDFNSPILIAHLFEAAKIINLVNDKKETLTQSDIDALKELLNAFVFDVLGLVDEQTSGTDIQLVEGLMSMILEARQTAKENKDWATSDKIRNTLQELGVVVKDSKEGATWELKKD